MARKFQTFTRDSQGRITSYNFKKAPSLGHLRSVVSQARQARAKGVGFNAQVGQFQGYEMPEAESRLIRAGDRVKTPERLLANLKGDRKEKATETILRALQNATGAERVADLRGVTINFSY